MAHKIYTSDMKTNAVEDSRKSRGLVVLHDESAQDGAGASLLCPSFTHDEYLPKDKLARSVWNALARSQLWNVCAWSSGFDVSRIESLKSTAAVRGMLHGEQARHLSNVDYERTIAPGGEGALTPDAAEDMHRVLWAALHIECLEYISEKINEIKVLSEIVSMPRKVNEQDWGSGTTLQEACEQWAARRTPA